MSKEIEDKAKEIVQKFCNAKHDNGHFTNVSYNDAKLFSIIHIEGIIDCIDRPFYQAPQSEIDYWNQVLSAIKNL